MNQTDFLVIGTGIAGLSAAELLSQKGKVTVLTKGKLKEANTYWAQGGIAAVMGKEDSFESHIADTLVAGADHNDPQAVRFLVEQGPKAIRFLESVGVKFETQPELEAGHSYSRVWRTSDFTGQDILNALIKTVKKNKNISIEEDTEAVELVVHENRCWGAFIRKGSQAKAEPLLAHATLLATGGLGQLFACTTNTWGSAGDGLALALKAGLELKDLEFIQFHPTAFARPTGSSGRAKPDEGRYFLLSETLRGFGAKILNHKGEPFLNSFHPKGELAARDIVARAVFLELMNGPVYLSMRHLNAGDIRERFPNIVKRLKSYGFDLTNDLVPITPAAHYSCGGIPANLKAETALAGLYAAGEVAATGVQGANRLASNSLLEAVVFAQSLAESMVPPTGPLQEFPLTPPELIVEDEGHFKAYAGRLGQIMWEHVGILRNSAGLRQARLDIVAIPARDYRIQHRQLLCYKIINACLARPQSLGCHTMTPDLA